jgi:hypothetical protein
MPADYSGYVTYLRQASAFYLFHCLPAFIKENSISQNPSSTLIGNHFGLVAWVVRDIEATEKFFRETLGVPRFLKMEKFMGTGSRRNLPWGAGRL